MMKTNKNSIVKIVSIIVIAFVVMLSVGWSAFGQRLLIDNIKLEVRPQKNIRVTGIMVGGTSSEAISTGEDYDVNNIKGNIYLPNPNSTITYEVEITNIGDVEMGILSLTGLPSNLDYEIGEGYSLKDKLCNQDKCSLGMKKKVYITIKYKDSNPNDGIVDGYDANKKQYAFQLDFDFRNFYSVEYVNINSNDFPKEVMAGDNLVLEFTDPPLSLIIKMGNNVLNANTDYTYENGVLTLNNVSGNLNVEAIMATLMKDLKININRTVLNPTVTAQCTAIITPDDTTNKKLVWSSSNESVATVNQNGLVTAHSVGEVTITAKSTDGSDLSDSVTIKVIPAPVINLDNVVNFKYDKSGHSSSKGLQFTLNMWLNNTFAQNADYYIISATTESGYEITYVSNRINGVGEGNKVQFKYYQAFKSSEEIQVTITAYNEGGLGVSAYGVVYTSVNANGLSAPFTAAGITTTRPSSYGDATSSSTNNTVVDVTFVPTN